MKEFSVFENAEIGSVRVVGDDGSAWLHAGDVCQLLGLGNMQAALARLEGYEKKAVPGKWRRKTWLISASGFYTLAHGLCKDRVREAVGWVKTEVIPPVLREAGLEKLVSDPDTLLSVLTELKKERETVKRLREIIEAQDELIGKLADGVKRDV